MKIILASNSPRRKDLLATLVEGFEIIPSEAEETSKIKELVKEPFELVEKLSIVKAKDIFDKESVNEGDLIVIGGDTVVYLERRNYGEA